MAKTRKARSKKTATRKMGKKVSKWTAFVKKVYGDMKKKNPSASLGDAMKYASKHKSEM